MATGRGILIYPKPINGPNGIQTQNSWLRIFCCSIWIFVVLSDGPLHIQCPYGASLVAQTVKNLPAMWETWVRSLGCWEDPLIRAWQPTAVFLPGESQKHRSLVSYSYGVAQS